MTKKLSICMIVKDEEKNLRRCLDSLIPLLERNDTELVIVDTGSTDDTVNIAKEYTRNIYFHDWNGNFSDMRNISISYAIGEWIFIMDADEELETPNEIIALIEDPKLKKFNTVRISEKNLLSIKLNKYVFHVQERLFRNDGTFQYRGTIHNQPVYKHPVYIADYIWLMHYGYINEDKELMEKKFIRTAGALIKELEKDPEYVYYRFQLARSYMMHGDSVIALEEMTKAYESMKRQPQELIVHRYYVFGEFARISLNVKKFEQVISLCLEGLSYNENYLDLYYYLGHAYCDLEDYKRGLESLNKYIELINKYNKNELDLSNFTAVEMYTLDKVTYEKTLERVISIIYKESIVNNLVEYKLVLEELGNINLKSKLLTKIFILENNEEKLVKLYNCIEETQRYPFINYLELLKKEFEVESSKLFEQTFSKVQDDYGLLNKIRISEEHSMLLLEFINNYDIIKFSDEIIIEFVKYLIEKKYLNRFFKKIDSLTIKKIVKVLIDKEDKLDYFLDSLRNEFKFNDFQNNRIYISIANVILLTFSEENKEHFSVEIMDIFEKYIGKGIKYIDSLYKTEFLRLTYSTFVNKEEKFLALLYLANSALEMKDIRNYKKFVVNASEEYPYFSRLLKLHIADHLGEDEGEFS